MSEHSSHQDNWDIFRKKAALAKESRDILYEQAKGVRNGMFDKNWIISSFGYAGFDVLKLRGSLITMVDGEDLTFLIIIFLMRGHNIAKIKASTPNKDVVLKLTNLEKRLKIRVAAVGKTLNVTLFRIATSFPEIVAMILKEKPDLPGPVRLQDIRASCGCEEFPAMARQPSLACLLPRTLIDSESYLNVFLFAYMMTSETINSKNIKWQISDKKTRILDAKVYQINAYNSVLLNESERKEWAGILGITTSDGEATAIWKDTRDKSKKALLSLYGDSY